MKILATPEIQTLVDLLEARADAHPDRLAYAFLADGEVESERLTYGDLRRRARALGAALAALDARGERALLLFPPGLDFAVAFFGCLYAGAIAVPVAPPSAARRGRLAAVVRDARPRIALTTPEIAGRWDGLVREAPALDGVRRLAVGGLAGGVDETAAPAPEWRRPELAPTDVAFLQYTANPAPRGVAVTHANLTYMEGALARTFAQGEEAIAVGWLPLDRGMGLIGNLLEPLAAGGSCVLMPPAAFLRRPRRWLEAITRYRATISGGPSFAYELCAARIDDLEGLDLSSWRVAFDGGEPVTAEGLRRFAAKFGAAGFDWRAFQPGYGLAEATLLVSGLRRGTGGPDGLAADAAALAAGRIERAAPGSRALELVGCGLVPPELEARIVDPDSGRPAEPGRVGEIWLAGPAVAAGYWGRPEETARVFGARVAGEPAAGPYLRTGDLGFLDGGELYVSGRRPAPAILDGRDREPRELERAAEPMPAIGGADAPAVDDPAGALPRASLAPLSAGQRGLWFLDRLAPGGAAYHLAAAFRLRGPATADDVRARLRSASSTATKRCAPFSPPREATRRRASCRRPSSTCASTRRPVRTRPSSQAAIADAPTAPSTSQPARSSGSTSGARGPAGLLLGVSLHHAVADFASLGLMLQALGATLGEDPPAGFAGAAVLPPSPPGRAERLAGSGRGRLWASGGEELAALPGGLDLPVARPRPGPAAPGGGGRGPPRRARRAPSRDGSSALARGATPPPSRSSSPPSRRCSAALRRRGAGARRADRRPAGPLPGRLGDRSATSSTRWCCAATWRRSRPSASWSTAPGSRPSGRCATRRCRSPS